MPLAHISEKRLAANRANAQKSTGPRTEKGKATVAENGCRTRAYARVHRMPPNIEAHFRARAEEKTRNIADLTRRTLHVEWWMLDGHRILHERREIALFKAGLARANGDEQIAKDWVLRQSGYIQTLNRYAGWVHAHTREVEKALYAKPEEMEAEFAASMHHSLRPPAATNPDTPQVGKTKAEPANQAATQSVAAINTPECTLPAPPQSQTQQDLADQTHFLESQSEPPAPPQLQSVEATSHPAAVPASSHQAARQPQTQRDLADQTHFHAPWPQQPRPPRPGTLGTYSRSTPHRLRTIAEAPRRCLARIDLIM